MVPVVMPMAVDIDHRALIARARNGAEEFELAERATVLAGRVTEAMRAELPRSPDRRTALAADGSRIRLGRNSPRTGI